MVDCELQLLLLLRHKGLSIYARFWARSSLMAQVLQCIVRSVPMCVCASMCVCNNNPTVDMSVTLHGCINAIINTCTHHAEAKEQIHSHTQSSRLECERKHRKECEWQKERERE